MVRVERRERGRTSRAAVGAIALIAGLLGAATARADELVVPSQEFPNLRKALKQARSGDVVRLEPGTYRLKRLDLRRDGVTLEGEGATVLLRNSRRKVRLLGDDTTVRGLHFDSSAVWAKGAGARIESCTFDGRYRREAVVLRGDNATLVSSELLAATVSHPAAGIVTASGDGSQVTDCLLHVNGAPTRSSYPAVLVLGDLVLVARNTITSRVGGEDVGVRIEATRTLVVDNLFRGLTGPAVKMLGSAARIEDNVVRDHGPEPALQLTGTSVRVSGNVFDFAGERHDAALRITAEAVTLSGNTIRGVDGPGLWLRGDGARIEDNAIEGAGKGLYTAIDVLGDDTVIDGNAVARLRSEGHGVRVTGDRAEILGNDVGNPDVYGQSHNGITLLGDDGSITDNTTDWVHSGVFVQGTGNTVARHTADRSRLHGVYVIGDGNAVTDCTLRTFRHDAVHVFGSGNTVAGCTGSGRIDFGSGGPSRGFSLLGDRNTLRDSSAFNLRDGGLVVDGADNLVERVTLAPPLDGVIVDGTGNRLVDCEVDAAGRAGFLVRSGGDNALVGCVSRRSSPGFAVAARVERTRLESCLSEAARAIGLDNDGTASTVLDSTFLGSAQFDVLSTLPPLLQERNTFETGSFGP